jgi:hypothetical protein
MIHEDIPNRRGEYLSAAGRHVRGGETNGWEFWAVKQQDGTLKTLAEYREQYQKDE